MDASLLRSCNRVTLRTNTCSGRVASCFAPEWAVLTYINREITSKVLAGFRTEVVNDKKGQRTAVASRFTETTLYVSCFIGNMVQMRSEIRFDRSWGRPGSDNGTQFNQFVGQ